jgi:hypothetical protein
LNALQELTRRYLADAERLGASPEELDDVMKKQVTHWMEDRLPVAETQSNGGENKS